VIQLPKRSVTRFFIPLIDVLILLFCIFLLLPFVSKADETSTATPSNTDPAVLAKRVKDLEDQMKLRDEELQRLMEERAKIAERTNVRVLEIDADTGELYYTTQDGLKPQRVRVENAGKALELIQRTKQTAEDKQAYFLILYPRTRSRFPTESQVRTYEQWFKTVPHQFDNPFASR
jgi:hypothetical protein